MSDRAANEPGDWRRRRQSSRADGGGQDTAGASAGPGEEQEAELSRTLFSFLEPMIDAIASFGAPIVIAGIAALGSGISIVAFVGSLKPYGIANIIIGVALIALVALISFSSVVAAFFGRTGKYGVNTVIMLAAFTGIVAVANFISFENHRRIDVTATNQFSLANRTTQLLKELPEPVLATAFYKENIRIDSQSTDNDGLLRQLGRKDRVKETLKEFAARSSKFSFRMVDPDLKPVIASSYFGTLPTGFVEESVVVEGQVSKGRDIVEPTDADYSELEQDLVTSILVATGHEKKTVYFLAGHGERGITNALGDGYSELRRGLESENYDVRVLAWDPSDENVRVPSEAGLRSCAAGEELLPEAALVVVARPSGELPLAHAEALDLYLRGSMRVPPECTAQSQSEADDWVEGHDGPSKWDTVPISRGRVQVWPKDEDPSRLLDRRESGRMIFLAEPDTKDSFRRFLLRWGVIVGSRHIRDLDRSVPGDPFTLRLAAFNPGAPTQIVIPKGERLQPVFMPGATPLVGLPEENVRFPLELAGTSANSYLIDDVERTDPITDAGDESDPRGTFFPAVLLKAVGPVGTSPPLSAPPAARISSLMVFGDSDFVANRFYERGGGEDFFLNSANYLMGDYSLVSIREKGFTFREFNLNRNERKFVEWSSWVMLPGLLGLIAALVWWMRR